MAPPFSYKAYTHEQSDPSLWSDVGHQVIFTGDGPRALGDDVEEESDEGALPGHQEAYTDRRVDVGTGHGGQRRQDGGDEEAGG